MPPAGLMGMPPVWASGARVMGEGLTLLWGSGKRDCSLGLPRTRLGNWDRTGKDDATDLSQAPEKRDLVN